MRDTSPQPPFRDRSRPGDGPYADPAFARRTPARRSLLAGVAVESLVVIGLITLIVGLVALQAMGVFGATVSEMSFLP